MLDQSDLVKPNTGNSPAPTVNALAALLSEHPAIGRGALDVLETLLNHLPQAVPAPLVVEQVSETIAAPTPAVAVANPLPQGLPDSVRPNPPRDARLQTSPMAPVAPIRPTIARATPPQAVDVPATPSAASDGALSLELLATLNLLRAEILDLRDLLTNIQAGQTSLEISRAYLDHATETIRAMMIHVQQAATQSGSASLQHMVNAWEQIQAFSLFQSAINPPANVISAQQQIQMMRASDQQCRRIIYWIGYLTISTRLHTWLCNASPGDALAFHHHFADEVPDADDRQQILNLLAASPKRLVGAQSVTTQVPTFGVLFDAESGLVYCTPTSTLQRAMNWAILSVGLMLSMIAVWGVASYVLPATIPSQIRSLQIGWLALLIGTVVHVVIGTNKRLRQQGSQAFLPLTWVILLIEANKGLILMKIMVALVGFLGLVFSGLGGDPNAAGFVFNAFLTGYSLDSVVELVGGNLEQRSASNASLLSKQISRV